MPDTTGDTDPAELKVISERLDRAGTLLIQLAEHSARGRAPTYEALSAALTLVLQARGRLYAERPPALVGSSRQRILNYLQAHAGEVISAAELAEVAGIRAWERRVRELREQGHDVEHTGSGYRLNS